MTRIIASKISASPTDEGNCADWVAMLDLHEARERMSRSLADFYRGYSVEATLQSAGPALREPAGLARDIARRCHEEVDEAFTQLAKAARDVTPVCA